MVGRDLNPFQGLLRTISVSSKLGEGLSYKEGNYAKFSFQHDARKGLSIANVTGKSEDRDDQRELSSSGKQFYKRQMYRTFAIHTSVLGLVTYHTVYEYIYVCMHICIYTCMYTYYWTRVAFTNFSCCICFIHCSVSSI